jgi:hypothetical protein
MLDLRLAGGGFAQAATVTDHRRCPLNPPSGESGSGGDPYFGCDALTLQPAIFEDSIAQHRFQEIDRHVVKLLTKEGRF